VTRAKPKTARRAPEIEIDPELLSVPHVARLLTISTTTVWELLRAGDLKSRRVGRSVRVSRSDLDEYVASLPAGYPVR